MAIADSAPGQVIRWHYFGYSAFALAVMTAAIMSHDRWFLNFVHVICGVLWTGIDLFMGFVVGPPWGGEGAESAKRADDGRNHPYALRLADE